MASGLIKRIIPRFGNAQGKEFSIAESNQQKHAASTAPGGLAQTCATLPAILSGSANFMQREGAISCLLLAVLLPAMTCAAPAPIKIGVISGLSGIAAKWDRFQNMGITLAQEELAALGVPISLVFEDSATQSPRTIAAFNKLIDFDRVDALLANDFGYVVAPLLPLAKQRRKLLVALSLPQDHYCRDGQGFFFSITSQFSQSRDAFESFFILHPEVRRIALVVFDDPEWGQSYRTIWTDLAKKHGVTVVDEFVSMDLTPDFRAALTKLLPRKPDAIFLAHEPVSFFKARAQLGHRGLVISANNVFEMLADSDTAEPALENVYLVDPVISEDFRRKFVARFKRQPILEAYAGYEGLRALARAFQENRVHPELAMAMLAYDGVAGPVDFTKGTCAGNFARWGLFQFRNGAPVEVGKQ